MKWFGLVVDDPMIGEASEVRNWLDVVNNKMYIELNKSNFNSESHELYLDLVVFGTGCAFEEEKKERWFGGLRFASVPPGRYCVAEGMDGRVDTVYRSIPMSVHGIIKKWKDTIPDELKDYPRPDEIWEVVHAVYPNGRGNGDFKWDSSYILTKTRTLLSEGGFRDFPYLVPRWTKYSDETYGRGPSHTAIPDIRTINKIIEMELRNLAKNVDPPLGAVGGDVVGPARMIPGGITTVKNKEALFKIDSTGNFQISNLKKEELRNSIHNIYMIDQLQLAQTGKAMTATEVNVRYETMQRILGPTLGRLEVEYTKPLIDRTFALMLRAGLFNPIPDILNKAARERGKPIALRIQYEGPLARAQRASDLTSISTLEQTIGPLIQMKQDAIDILDIDELTRHAATISGVPSKAIRDKEQVDGIRKAAQEQMEKQQGQEEMGQQSEAMKNAAPMVKAMQNKPQSGSMMEKLQQNAGGR
jgi:hypothetical protein